jgi:hypothetical protein
LGVPEALSVHPCLIGRRRSGKLPRAVER